MSIFFLKRVNMALINVDLEFVLQTENVMSFSDNRRIGILTWKSVNIYLNMVYIWLAYLISRHIQGNIIEISQHIAQQYDVFQRTDHRQNEISEDDPYVNYCGVIVQW